MKLVNCSKCGEDFLGSYKECPKCGKKRKLFFYEEWITWVITLGAIIIIFIFINM